MRITESKLRSIIRSVIAESLNPSQIIFPKDQQVHDMYQKEKDRLRGRKYWPSDYGKSSAFLKEMGLDLLEAYNIVGVYFEKTRINPNHKFNLEDFPKNTHEFLEFYYAFDTRDNEQDKSIDTKALEELVEKIGIDEDEF